MNDKVESGSNNGNESVQIDIATARTITNSIQKKTISLYEQKIWNSDKQQFDKTEILSRFVTAQWQIINPCVFLQVIDKHWLQKRFDLVVLEQTLSVLQVIPNWSDMIYAINLNKQTVSDNYSEIIDLVLSTKVDASRILFELTEWDCESCYRQTWIDTNSCHCDVKNIWRINKWTDAITNATWITFWLDDFPTWSNCIFWAQNLKNVSFIKFDGTWIGMLYNNIVRTFPNPQKRFIMTIRSIMKELLAINPELTFVVEKIENKEMYDLFQSVWNIKHYQWYYFDKPHEIIIQ